MRYFSKVLSFKFHLGRGDGGLVVSVVFFFSDGTSSNPNDDYNLFCKMLLQKKKKINKRRGRGWPIKNLFKIYCHHEGAFD